MTAAVSHAIIDATVSWGSAWLTAGAIAAAAFGWGRLALAPVDHAMDGPRADRRLATLAVGAGLLALLILVIGLAGVLYRPVLIGLLLAGAAGWLRRSAPPAPHAPISNPDQPPHPDHALTRLAIAAGRGLALALIAFGVLMPEFFHDALIYHLELPRYYLLHHRIGFLPWNYNSALPANIESLYLIALAFSDERATKLIHAAFALLCVAALGALGRHVAPRAQASGLTGRLAGTLFLLTPSVPLLAGVSGNDLGLLFFELMSLLAWWRWRMTLRDPQETPSPSSGLAWLICSGLLMGLAIGTKYSAFFFLAGMTAAWGALLGSTHTQRRLVLRAFGGWLLIAMAAGSPWLVKNLLTTGDPVYPMFAAHLNQSFLDAAGVAWLRHDLGAGGIAPGLWPDYLLKLAANDIGWFTLAAAAITAVFVLSRSRHHPRYHMIQPLLALIAASTVIWWFVSPVPRYLLPTAALLSLLGAIGLGGLAAWSSAGRAARAAVGIVVTVGLLGQWLPAAGLIRDNYITPFTVLTGLRAFEPGRPGASTKEAASSISELIPDGAARRQWLAWSVPPYAAIDAANRLLPDTAVVLFVGEYRGYYLNRDRIISTKYDTSPLVHWAGTSASVQELEGWLRREGVTHLLYNQVEARRLEQVGYPALRWPNQASRERFEQLRRERLTLLTVQNGVFLYAVGRSSALPPPPAAP
jgi:hypothetical protein